MYSVGCPSASPAQRKERNKRQVMARDNLLHLFMELGDDETSANEFRRTTRLLDIKPDRTLVFNSIVYLVVLFLGSLILGAHPVVL